MLIQLLYVLTTLLALTLGQHRVINGNSVKPFSYKFAVSLQAQGEHFCGGSLISSDTVLTAGHCVNRMDTVYASIHRHNLAKSANSEGGVTIEVKDLIRHPKYKIDIDLGLARNDIAIFKLKSAVPKNIEINIIHLNKHSIKENTPVQLVGWGSYKLNDDTQSKTLLTANFTISNFGKCNSKYEGGLKKSKQICAVNVVKKQDGCHGDSGGPLFMADKKGNYIQVGVVSFGQETCDSTKGFPSVYTNVNYYLKWIHKYMSTSHKKARIFKLKL